MNKYDPGNSDDPASLSNVPALLSFLNAFLAIIEGTFQNL